MPTTSEEKRSFLSKVCFTGKTINLTTAETLGINKIKLTPKGFCVLNFDKSLNKENINGSYEFVDNEFFLISKVKNIKLFLISQQKHILLIMFLLLMKLNMK